MIKLVDFPPKDLKWLQTDAFVLQRSEGERLNISVEKAYPEQQAELQERQFAQEFVNKLCLHLSDVEIEYVIEYMRGKLDERYARSNSQAN